MSETTMPRIVKEIRAKPPEYQGCCFACVRRVSDSGCCAKRCRFAYPRPATSRKRRKLRRGGLLRNVVGDDAFDIVHLARKSSCWVEGGNDVGRGHGVAAAIAGHFWRELCIRLPDDRQTSSGHTRHHGCTL